VQELIETPIHIGQPITGWADATSSRGPRAGDIVLWCNMVSLTPGQRLDLPQISALPAR